MVLQRRESFFSSHIWSTIPFSLHQGTAFDRLLDILHLIPGCLHRYCCEQNTITQDDLPSAAEEILRLIGQLEQWQCEFMATTDHHQGLMGILWPFQPSIPNDGDSLDQSSVENMRTTTSYASATAFLHSTYILLYSLLSSTDDPACPYRIKAICSAETVLSLSQSAKCDATNMAPWTEIMFPLCVVSIWSPCTEQRTVASRSLLRWGSSKGLERFLGIAIAGRGPWYLLPSCCHGRRKSSG